MILQYRIKGDFVWKECRDLAQYERMKNAKSAEVRQVTLEVAYEELKQAYNMVTGKLQ